MALATAAEAGDRVSVELLAGPAATPEGQPTLETAAGPAGRLSDKLEGPLAGPKVGKVQPDVRVYYPDKCYAG